MSNKSNKWKDFLLKSSIPLEYEVKTLLDKYGCVGNYEYTYLRRDENEIVNEFSYDIDASFIKGGHFFELMIECKYRDQSTNWVFIPEAYGGIGETDSCSFINPNDHFTQKNKFLKLDYEPLAPLCGKGIEINSEGQNPRSISQAVNQLSYAMAEKILDGMEHQIEKLLGSSEIIFYNIPIIVTTANLFRLNKNVTIEQIKQSNNLSDVSTEAECLILKSTIGKDLEKYNIEVFCRFMDKYGKDYLNKKLKSFNKDIEFVLSVIAKNYCPEAFAIIHFSKENVGFKSLFEYLNEIVEPTEKTLNREREHQKLIEKVKKDLNEVTNKAKSKNKE